MSQDVTICVGTIGSGIWRSPDGGETGLGSGQSLPGERCQGIGGASPSTHLVYAGTDTGVYRSEDRGASWERLDSPMNAMQTWALALDPSSRTSSLPGPKPPAVFRSQDGGSGGKSWPWSWAEECPAVVIPR